MAKLKDYKRIFSLTEKCYSVGEALKRKGVKSSIIAGAGIGIIALGTNTIIKKYTGRDFPINTLNATAIPATLGLTTYILGQGLTTISNIFSNQRLNFADANLLRQMEDEKKSRSPKHLSQLWTNVFKEESQMYYNSNKKKSDNWNKKRKQEIVRLRKNRKTLLEQIDSFSQELKDTLKINNKNKVNIAKHLEYFNPFSKDIETTKRGFKISANYALINNFHQREEKNSIGFDISQLEAWYNGAPLTPDDEVLNTFFAYQKSIKKTRSKIGIPIITKLKETIFKNKNPQWHTRSMKKIGILTGTQIEKLDKKYVSKNSPSYFTAQDILWRKPEVNEIIKQDFKEKKERVINDLNKASKSIIRTTFSDDKKTAHNQIYWMFGKDYLKSLKLKIEYDIERTVLSLNNPLNPLNEIKILERELMCNIYPHKKINKKIKESKKNIKTIDRFLKEYLPEIYQDPIKRRSARIGYNLNQSNIQKYLTPKNSDVINIEKTKDILENKVIKSYKKYNERIQKTRIHHELTKIQLIDYIDRIDKLGEY